MANRGVFVDVEVGRSTVLLLLEALSHVGIVLIFLLAVFFCWSFHSCGFCHSYGLGIYRILSGCISVDDGLVLVHGCSCNQSIMVWTVRVDYAGRVVIVIGINISRLFLRFYVIVPASISIIIIIVVIVIIFSRDILLTDLSVV